MASSIGLKREAGGLTGGFDHVLQSIRDILATPIGSRVMRREYGSELPWLVDKPMDDRWILKVYVAAARALARWEPRVSITKVLVVSADQAGRLGLSFNGIYYPRGHLGDKSNPQPFADARIWL